MNKYNRSKHIKILQLMEEAALAIPGLINEGKEQDVLLVLGDCQDVAVAMGGHIEKLYGLQTQTVRALEEYCTALYQVSVSMDENSLITLAESIERIWSTYDEEFPEKKEIVFMPYKSSMWDSMESIWRAAILDDTNEVVVMPLPYYNLDSNGNYSELNWEGKDFPDYVDVTKYDDYDIELRHPDVVVIHNPYDGNNKITRVSSEYFSDKLKENTSMLVYVPYYVLPGKPIEKDNTFVLQTGVINSDYVFVQNQQMKDFYLKVLEPYCDKSELDKKIIAIGSPKTDKVIFEEQNLTEIPQEWKEKIKGKKVLFFNTNLSLILNNNENIFDYMQKVFDTFRDHPEFIVIWREHPLTISTLEAMRPELMERYVEMRDLYINEGYGILDETPEPHLAMAVSDCYYGAGGSLSAIYPVTGKPLLIMDYQYPKRISDKMISTEELKGKATDRMLYVERNINTLDVFMSDIEVFIAEKEDRIKCQAIRMDNLDGTVGEKIYQYFTKQ